MDAELFLAAGAELGEGPLALDDGAVAWVDILRGIVHRTSAAGDDDVLATMGEPVGALALTADGSLVGATRSGLRRVCAGEGPHELLVALPPGDPDLRMNDGKVDPAGRFVGGTMTLGEPRPAAGTLWSFSGDGVTPLVPGVTISNGLAWSGDGATLFFIDTPTRGVDAFDYDVATGRVSERRRVISIAEGAGDPDGMCIDVEGGLWVALFGGAAVHRYVDGRLDAVVELPTPHVTCPAFTGPALDRLLITTASEPFGDEAPPGAGDLYVVEPGITATAPNRLGGWVVA